MIVVTGSTGNSGTHFIRELEAHGFDQPVRCLVRTSTAVDGLVASPLDIEVLTGELDDPTFLDVALSGADTVVHIASLRFSPAIVAAALRQGVRRVLLVHTAAVFSRHKSASLEYRALEAQVAALLAATEHQIEVTILRPTMIFGQPRDHNVSVFIRLVDRLRVVPLINGGASTLQPVHASDLGRAYHQALTRGTLPRAEYVLSGERPVRLRELLQQISSGLGKRTLFVAVPLLLAGPAARAVRALTANRVDVVEKVLRMGEDRSFPHDRAAQDFGYAPRPVADTLAEEVAWYVARHATLS
ncbi:NAD(P)H-binding protein [Propioniciclava soli]|uniref:NAD(P)H-binding protein n=1 Tax=Propioniciclava soli TaxID=2775081 RepID=A0ABZ3C9V9_9ACTN